jgi:hypothetical protein
MSKKTNKAVAEKGVVADSKVKGQVEDIKEILTASIASPTTIEELWAVISPRLQAIEEKLTVKIKEGNGRGPISTRAMTVDDAIKIMTGGFKDKTIKDCAKELGLSYGQVYSARNGYTFKEQYAAMKALKEKK